MDTDPTFNPGCKATGHWNFFAKKTVDKKDGAITVSHNSRWSFEWKHICADNGEDEPLLFNDVYGILMDAANCIWSDEWRIGATPIVEYTSFGTEHIKTQIVCEDGGSITTKAGTFDNCLKLSLDISGMDGGLSYRGGKKEYYFAEGIGIVRTVNEYCNGARKAVYDLVSYTGTADGYMPVANGLVREYEAIGTTDGYRGGAKYTYVEEDGHTAIFADRTGIRVIPAPTTSYSYILGEEIEDRLGNEGKLEEAHLKHAVNNFNIMLHYLARPARHRNNAVRSIGICAFNMNLMESFGDGEVPPAWLGLYVWASLIRSAALFGNDDKEEGYKYLDCAIEACERWSSYKKDDLLETGNEQVFGGVKLIKGRAVLLLPDGTREPASYSYRLDRDAGLPYTVLTMPSGWEWFNSVRDEERFKEYIDRAKKMTENS